MTGLSWRRGVADDALSDHRWEVVDLNRHDGTPTWRDSRWRWRWQARRRARELALTRRAGVRDRRNASLEEVVLMTSDARPGHTYDLGYKDARTGEPISDQDAGARPLKRQETLPAAADPSHKRGETA